MTCGLSGSADAKSYILISRLPSNLYEKYVVDANAAYMSGFTFVIISMYILLVAKFQKVYFKLYTAVIILCTCWTCGNQILLV
jgi:hypothetical protein